MNTPENQLDGACSQLADYLQTHKEVLISDWLKQAANDPAVPSESLTKLEILDHVPKIFDAIVQALRKQCSDAAMEQVQDIAVRHTIIRWVQRYDLQAVLREVSFLRAEFIRRLRVFNDEHAGLSSEARLFNSTTVHGILDDIIMDATGTFLRLKARDEG